MSRFYSQRKRRRIGYYDTPSCIYYLILFQCDIFQITYNSHIHNITVDFRCPYTFAMPQQLLGLS